METTQNSFFGRIISYFVRHKTAANLLLIIMVVMGLLSLTKIRAQFFPDVVLETVTVSVKWKGAGSEDIDVGIVELLEPNLLGIDGVEEIISTSREGSTSIVIDFEPSTDMRKATDDVKSAVELVNDLPENAEEPIVRRRVWRDRVTNVMISGDLSSEQLGLIADEFNQKLYRQGVSKTSISGFQAPLIRVAVPENKLIQYGVSLAEIAQAIRSAVESKPSGEVGNGSRVRSGVAKRSIEEIRRIVLRPGGSNASIKVGDISIVKIDGSHNRREYFVGELPAVLLRVDRDAFGDAIDIQKLVEDSAADFQETLPKGVKIELSQTRAAAISNRLNILLKNGGQGLCLVIILLFLFLSARTALWVAVGIPAAMLASIGLMYMSGITLNMISLFALILCLGIVVDDAIVVAEHADFRARRLAEDPTNAAERAAIRMALPVFTATITTVIAFAGLVAIGGRFGSLIADIPFTVIVVLLASLLECFLILPNHMVHALKAKSLKTAWFDWPSEQFNRGFRYFRDVLFRPLTELFIRIRYPIVGGAVLLLALSSTLLISGEIKWRFFNAPERGGFTGNIAMLPNAMRSDTKEMLTELNRATKEVAESYEKRYGSYPVIFSNTQLGGNSGRGISGAENKEPNQLGSITVELIDADLRPYSSFAFLGDLQDSVLRHPRLETLSFRGWRSGPGSDSLSVSFLGYDSNVLKNAAEYFKAQLVSIPGITGLEDSQSYDKNELVLELTARGVALGFTTDSLGIELYQRLNGIEAASFPVRTRSAKIIVGLPESEITNNFLNKTRIKSPKGNYVHLSDIVSTSSSYGFSTIKRENGQRQISVTGDISEDNPQIAEDISNLIQNELLPEITIKYGVKTYIGGLAQQERKFKSDALLGLLLALIGIYLSLTWVFSSWSRPIIVMAAIPFGLIGTLWGHYIWGVSLSMFSVIGLIGMTGIIINDSIVLISTIDEYSKMRGSRHALVDAVSDRLRPVLLTTLTTVLGLAPLLFETSKDAQFLKPTVITLVYGLAFGSLIVLFLVPALVSIQQDLGNYSKSFRRILIGRRSPFLAKVIFWSGLLFVLITFVLMIFWTLLGSPGLSNLWLPDFLKTNQNLIPLFQLLVCGLITLFLLLVLIPSILKNSFGRKG